MSYEFLFVASSVVASIIGYGSYYLSIYRKEARPHVFSWLNWGLMVAIGACAEFQLKGGLSVWGLAFMSFNYLAVAAWGLFFGEKNITRSDWVSSGGALLSIVLWGLTDNPVVAIALLMAFDVLSYWPTVRKSWHDPWSEPPMSYFWAGLRYFFLLFAVPHPAFSNLIYPFWLMSTDWGFMLCVIARRKMLARQSIH